MIDNSPPSSPPAFDPVAPVSVRRLCYRMAEALNWPADLRLCHRPGVVLSAGSQEVWHKIARIAELEDIAATLLALDDLARVMGVDMHQKLYGDKEVLCPVTCT